MTPVPWPTAGPDEALSARIEAPAGAERVATSGFGAWLRDLPVLPAGSPVRAFDGRELRAGTDPIVLAVVDIDVGTRDLQQCADSILRLRAEYLWQAGQAASVAFHFTSGDLSRWTDWAAGKRASVSGNHVAFTSAATPDATWSSFRRYEDALFTYAGTRSLAREGALAAAGTAAPGTAAPGDVEPGEFLVRAGSPGHAVLVLDVARASDGRQWALIGEGYMPAQSFHVLRGPAGGWYPVEAAGLTIPTWPDPFDWTTRRRF